MSPSSDRPAPAAGLGNAEVAITEAAQALFAARSPRHAKKPPREKRRATDKTRRSQKGETVVLPGVPITDPAWAEARRGRKPPNANKVYPQVPLSIDVVVAIIETAQTARHGGAAGVRDEALFTLLWRGGLRVIEAVDLFPEQLDLDAGYVFVAAGKYADDGTSALDPEACAVLQRWLDKRRELGIPETRPLFCTVMDDAHVHGERWRALSTAYVRNRLKYLARQAGVTVRVTPHSFRHTMVAEMTEAGISLDLIQAQLRHKHILSTAAYQRKVHPTHLREVVRARAWPNEARHIAGLRPPDALAPGEPAVAAADVQERVELLAAIDQLEGGDRLDALTQRIAELSAQRDQVLLSLAG